MHFALNVISKTMKNIAPIAYPFNLISNDEDMADKQGYKLYKGYL